MAEAVLPALTLTEEETHIPTERVLSQHALVSDSSSLQSDRGADMGWPTDAEEKEMSGTEHLRLPEASCKAEEFSSEAGSFSPLSNNVEECCLKVGAGSHPSDSECSDVDLDNDWVGSEDLDSDSSIEGIEDSKKSKWLRPFFEMLKDPAVDPIAEHTLFYCPACRGSGLGEVSVYKGFKPLIAHAKQYQKRRVKLHRDFAAILEEDVKRFLPTEPYPMDAACGQMSNGENLTGPLIVWPPMVFVQFSGTEVGDHHKRAGLRSRQILESFKEYRPRKVVLVYDDKGTRTSMSLLVFQDSPAGYLRAKRLAQNFKFSRRGRVDWDDLGAAQKLQPVSRGMFYGYMAKEDDMVIVSTSDARKRKVKWDLKRYQDVILEPLGQMQDAKLYNNLLNAKLQEQEEHNRNLERVLSKLYNKQELEEEEVHLVAMIAAKQLVAESQKTDEAPENCKKGMLEIEVSDDGW